MKRFFSQPALKHFITPQKTAKPQFLLKNALALSNSKKIKEFYESCQEKDLQGSLNDEELFQVLKVYLNSFEPRNYNSASDLVNLLESRKMIRNLDFEIQKLKLNSGNSIESVVNYFKSKIADNTLNLEQNQSLTDFYNGFLEIICLQYNRLQAGLSILDQMIDKSVVLNSKTLFILIKTAVNNADIKTAMDLFKRVENKEFEFDVDRDILVETARVFAMNGDTTATSSFLQLIKVRNWKWSQDCWAALMLAHEKNGQLADVVKVYESFRKKGGNLVPTTEMFEILMRAYSNDNDLSGAIRTYGLSGILSIEPSVEMHKILIQAHLKKKEDDVAWNRCFSALNTLNTENSKIESWDIPSELILPLAQNAMGKHHLFVLERITLGELPELLYPRFLTSLISHWVSNQANDPHLAVQIYSTLLPGGQFEKYSSLAPHSELSALVCIAKSQKNELEEAFDIFEKNIQNWTSNHCFKVYSEMVKGYLKIGKIKEAISIYSKAQESGNVSSPLLESLLENYDKLDSSILEYLGQVSIDSGCIPCPRTEPLLFKRLTDMKKYAKI